ncbi:MAG: GatB/YqeY domain-containing protein [Desulfurivibrionaceae bacterium]|nr:GatB/YqeY domain-containing protein [Desulfobulbales bacterium]MDT8336116.1 GatB/YqeY domain-containing protein [Desulfurivibrionaceae bacterium]
MTLQEKIKADLKKAMLARDTARTSTLRIILGEFARQPNKELTDQEVRGVLRKLVKSENEMMAAKGTGGSAYLEALESYLPKQPTEAEIRAWIAANIDFADYANKMQAMKPIMTNFGGAADGNLVRKILESY